jgi:L,D-transpeptidase ErfK/SrfK
MVYLEAHTPFEETGTIGLKKAYAKLKRIERKTGQALDWDKIKRVVAEARGIPVAVSAFGPGGEAPVEEVISLRHPAELYGQPQVPELRTDGWYVLAGILSDEVDARRLAAIINHQGPQIPASVLSMGSRHRVLAGPFDSRREARHAAKRLKIDLEIDGPLIAPVHAAELAKSSK